MYGDILTPRALFMTIPRYGTIFKYIHVHELYEALHFYKHEYVFK